jgi:hypothetical protein
MSKTRRAILAIAGLLSVLGCSDERLARMAQETTQRQAEQNEAMAEVSRESVQASGRLVETEGQARQELLAMQHDLQEQQAQIGQERDKLEAERRGLAGQRLWDSALAAAITDAVLVLACLAPLVLCWYVLRAVRGESNDAIVAEVLVEELASEKPRLLSPDWLDRPGLCDSALAPSRLPGPTETDGGSDQDE